MPARGVRRSPRSRTSHRYHYLSPSPAGSLPPAPDSISAACDSLRAANQAHTWCPLKNSLAFLRATHPAPRWCAFSRRRETLPAARTVSVPPSLDAACVVKDERSRVGRLHLPVSAREQPLRRPSPSHARSSGSQMFPGKMSVCATPRMGFKTGRCTSGGALRLGNRMPSQ